MLYLSGAKNPVTAEDMASGRLGLLMTPSLGYRLDNVAVWALDNACFTDKYPGDDEFLAYMAKRDEHKARCLFVCAPDVIGDSAATLARFPVMARRIRAAGWRVALVAQDGLESRLDSVPWELVDWLFIGGSTEWKLSAAARRVIAEGQTRGKRVHVGRVNSLKRFAYFHALDCDTADGTYLAFGPKVNKPKLDRWHEHVALPRLW